MTSPAAGQYDVVVVGLGPVGALLAVLLGRAGLHVLAVERQHAPFPQPRAIAMDDEVLRILRGLPDGHEFLDEMLLGCCAEFVDGGGRLIVRVQFPGSGPELPGLATFHQPTLERQLASRLAALPVEVRRGVALVDLSQGVDGVTLRLSDSAAVRARWVVGADGAGSVVRRTAAIELAGRRFAEPWLVVDLAAGPPEGDLVVRFGCDPQRPSVCLPMPGGHRWEFLLRQAELTSELLRPEEVTARLRSAGVPADARVERSALYTYSAQTAERWRAGRVLLAGDAAHQMPPFSGQGLSAGLRDAAALGWRLALVVRGVADDRLLDGYQRERLPHVQQMTRLALFVGRVVQTRRPGLARARDSALRVADATPRLGGWLRSGGPRPAPRLPRSERPPLGSGAGRLLPAVPVRRADGSMSLLDEMLGGGHSLIAEGDPFEGLSDEVRRTWEAIGTRRILIGPSPRGGSPETVVDPGGKLRRLLRGGRVLVVRPDRYVVAAVPFRGLPGLTNWYARRLGLRREAVAGTG